jgi:peptidoglycan/xylan/chitin deacetylase (PgdA/CDA1 family)
MNEKGTIGTASRAVPILAYHKVDRESHTKFWVSAASFERQMAALKERGFESMSLHRLRQCALGASDFPARPLCITFDDGYENFLSCAFPILQKYGYSATVFLPTGFIGKDARCRNDWDRSGEERSFRASHLVWPEVLELHRRGVEFGAHTRTHRDLEALFNSSPREAEEEIRASKREIEAMLAIEVEFLSYPYKVSGAGVEALARRAGFSGAVTVNGRFFDTGAGNWFAMDRVPVFSRGIDEKPEDARRDCIALLQGVEP